MVLLAIVAGLLIGLSLGTLGGGSLLTVPVLVYLLGQDPHQATTASLLVIAASSATALAARAGHAMASFDRGLIAAFATAAVLGTLAGTKAAGRIRPQQLSAAFTVLITLVAAFTLARSVPRIA